LNVTATTWLIWRLRRSTGRSFVPVIRAIVGRDRWLSGAVALPVAGSGLFAAAGGLGFPVGWPFTVAAAPVYFAALVCNARARRSEASRRGH
jgi:hypothetical protein